VQLSLGGEDTRFAPLAAHEEVVEGAAGRGEIIGADGSRLATSLRAAEVVATPYQVEDPEATAEVLAGILGPQAGDAGEIEGKLTARSETGELAGYSVVAAGVEPEAAREVEDKGLAGIYVTPDEVRAYPEGASGSQVLGYLGEDEAFGGVEAYYDERLRHGEDVRVNLDAAVQAELEGALVQAVRENDAESAMGLVMRVEDGGVVALANTPGYDNNHFSEAPDEAQRNRLLTDPYEPGSTFKPFTVAAALEASVVNEGSTFVVPDSIAVADRVVNDSEEHATEVMDVTSILEHSSNVGTIQIAQLLGGERLDESIRRFGFGEPTGVDLGGEAVGTVPAYEEWSGSSIGNIPIGQGLSVTPLQLAAGYATLANGGLAVTPRVAEGDAPEGAGRRVISEETSTIVRRMLSSVVESGTGHLARVPGYTAAGKTGTAQKVDPETGLYGEDYVSSFVGFAPASDPEYVVLIVVDDPEEIIWGERVAAPAFRKVMSFTLSYFNVPPDGARATAPQETP
jgi:cell division protein FtsI/penicillin-binding protein 2